MCIIILGTGKNTAKTLGLWTVFLRFAGILRFKKSLQNTKSTIYRFLEHYSFVIWQVEALAMPFYLSI